MAVYILDFHACVRVRHVLFGLHRWSCQGRDDEGTIFRIRCTRWVSMISEHPFTKREVDDDSYVMKLARYKIERWGL